MRKNTYKTTWSTQTLVFMSVLVAMTLVLSRMLAIDLGFARFTLGSICTIMAGLWFGPAAGAACGFAADILGCLMQGYAVNPLITVGAMCWGIIPALMKPLMTGGKVRKTVVLCLSVLLSSLAGTMGFTYAGLVLVLGYDFWAILPTRLAQFAAMTPVYCVLTCCLYFSPLTSMLHNMQIKYANRKAANAAMR